MFLLDHC